MHTQILLLIGVAGLMFLIIGGLAFISHYYTLNGIKSKTVGDGQHGTARWATKQEIRQTYAHIPFEPELWRQGKNLPDQQGLILGCEGPKGHVTAVVDTDDIHALVTAASGAGKTAFFLYPNIEYALATGMSFLCTDTKGDLFRNYAGIARECYGYQTAILDLRNPTRSDGNNLLHLSSGKRCRGLVYILPLLVLTLKFNNTVAIVVYSYPIFAPRLHTRKLLLIGALITIIKVQASNHIPGVYVLRMRL